MGQTDILGFVMNFLDFLVFCLFCTSVLKNKNFWLTTLVWGAVLGYAAPELCKHLPAPVSFGLAILLYGAYLLLSYKGTVKEKIIVYCVGYSTINLTMFLVSAVLSVFGYAVDEQAVVFVLCYLLLVSSVLFMISKTWKSIHFVMSNPKFRAFFLLPVSQLALMILSVFFMTKITGDNVFDQIVEHKYFAIATIVVVAVSFIADGIVINGMSVMADNIRQKERLQALELENSMTYDYIKSMEGDLSEMRRYRHDFLNLLTTVQLTLKEGNEESIAEAESFIDRMTDEISGLTGRRYCGCNIVNCMLSYEADKLSKADISCDFRAEIPDALGVGEVELCRVVTNLLDNAREGCLQLENCAKRQVCCNMRVVSGYLYIVVRNTKKAGKLTLESTKNDPTMHGLGLGIVRDIVKSFDGELIIADEDTSVTFTATMKWE